MATETEYIAISDLSTLRTIKHMLAGVCDTEHKKDIAILIDKKIDKACKNFKVKL